MLRTLFASGEFERELRERPVDRRGGRSPGVAAVVPEVRGDREPDPAAAGRRRARLGPQSSFADSAASQDAGFKAIPRGQHSGGRAAAAVGCRAAAQGPTWRPWSWKRSGKGSHAALLAREKGIPRSRRFQESCRAISSRHGTVGGWLSRHAGHRPDDHDTRREFQERLEKWRATLVRCKAACREPARTLRRPVDRRRSQYRHPR